MRLITGGTGSTVKFGAVRVLYKLHLSPAPAIATFNDVPTSNAQFKFVEALVAAGITGRRGGGNYCPDARSREGRWRSSFATALGLHCSN